MQSPNFHFIFLRVCVLAGEGNSMINQFPICTPLRCYVSDEYMYIERNDTCLTLFSDFDILNSIYLTSMEGRFRIFYGVFFLYFFYLKDYIFWYQKSICWYQNSEFLISKNHFLITKFWFFDVRNANWFLISQSLFFDKMAIIERLFSY